MPGSAPTHLVNPDTGQAYTENEPVPIGITNAAEIGAALANRGASTPVALVTAGPLNAGANTLTFAGTVKTIRVQNNSGVDIGWEVGGTATAGSEQIVGGSAGTISEPNGTTTVSLYVASTVALNGSAAGNVVVKGFA